MLATQKHFEQLTAADVMSRDVLMIPQQMDLRTAAHLLSQVHISGAPVTDREGVCVGVLSTTDFVHWAEGEPGRERTACATECVCSDWQVVEVDLLPEESVGRYMTPDPVTASADVPLRELARMMIDAHIHRVIIVDERNRPVGVLSTTDILAAWPANRPSPGTSDRFRAILTRRCANRDSTVSGTCTRAVKARTFAD
jgi:CBS-domain-containing membrane protein